MTRTEQFDWTAGGEALRSLSRLGFWSALLSTVLSVGFAATIIVMYTNLPAADPPAGLYGIEAYRAAFDPILELPLIPSLLLAPTFTVLMVCIHYYAAPARRIWSHLGLAFTIIYAVMAFTNYIIQLTSVQRSLLAGETDGLEMFVHGYPHSIFWALVSAYIFMNLGMLFAAPVFQGGSLETWIRRFFLLNGASVVLTISSIWLDNPLIFNLGSLFVWTPIFSVAAGLTTVLFYKLGAPALEARAARLEREGETL